jgi:hypothetical protein
MNNNKLLLDAEIYPVKLIAKAIGNYRRIANISCQKENLDFALVFENCYFPVQQTMLEFENHLIELSNIKNMT